jgi:hypothetical protein
MKAMRDFISAAAKIASILYTSDWDTIRDSPKEEHGEELTCMYASEMDLPKGPVKLTPLQVTPLKAVAGH